MAFIGSLQATGSSTTTVVGEARFVDAGIGGGHGSSGSIALVLESGDIGNASHYGASGSISFVRKNGGNYTVGGSIISSGSQDLIFSSSTSHGDIRFKVNDAGTEFNPLTITSGRAGSGTPYRGPTVFVTDGKKGYGNHYGGGKVTLSRGRGLFNAVHVNSGTDVEVAGMFSSATTNVGILYCAYLQVDGTEQNRFYVKSGEVIVNETGDAVDFRVESDNRTNMLYVDGTNNRVAIGNNAPMGALDINQGGDVSNTGGIVLRHNDQSGVSSTHKGINVLGSGQLQVSGTNGKVRLMGGKAAVSPEIDVLLLGQTNVGGTRANSIIRFGSRNHADNGDTVYWSVGYDATNEKFMFVDSSTFSAGGNERLSFSTTENVINEGAGNEDFRVESQTQTHLLFLDNNVNRLYIGDGTPSMSTAGWSKLTVEHTVTDLWDANEGSANEFGDFTLTLRNPTTTVGALAGIAFDISTEVDNDAIGAAILAVRHSNASTNATLHDADLVFATNDQSDDDLQERMRITNDGRVAIGVNNIDGQSGTAATVEGLLHLNSIGSPTMVLSRTDSDIDDGEAIGVLSWRGSEDSGQNYTELGKLVVQADQDNMDLSSDAPSTMNFHLVPNSSTTLTEVMVLDGNGNLQIDGDLTVSGNDIKDSGGNTILSSNGDGFIDSDLDVVGTNYSLHLVSRVTGNGVGEPIISIHTEQGTSGFSQGTDLGQIMFKGSNNSFGAHVAGSGVGGCAILAEADGTWNSTDYPSRLHFLCTDDGAVSPTVRARLDHDGDWLTEGSHSSGASLFTEGHRYSSDQALEPGDTVVLAGGKILKSTGPMQKNVAGIVFYREHERWGDWPIHDDAGGDEDDENRDLSACNPTIIKDSFENSVNRGIYNSETGEWEKTDEFKKLWKLASVGDSRQGNLVGFKICDEGGAVDPGDLLCTSSTAGYLMKQSDDIIRSYTVGKAMESVTFDSDGMATGVYGYVYCG